MAGQETMSVRIGYSPDKSLGYQTFAVLKKFNFELFDHHEEHCSRKAPLFMPSGVTIAIVENFQM